MARVPGGLDRERLAWATALKARSGTAVLRSRKHPCEYLTVFLPANSSPSGMETMVVDIGVMLEPSQMDQPST